MTFEQLQAASANIKTTPIRGKQYAEVPQRVKAFRLLHPNGSIVTEIVSLQDGVCVMKATVCDENGAIISTGTAYEREGSTNINKTSYIENCETSAVGRALAFMGLGIDLSIASYEEVENAIEQQNGTEDNTKVSADMVKTLKAQVTEYGLHENSIAQNYKKDKIEDMTIADFRNAMDIFEKHYASKKKGA